LSAASRTNKRRALRISRKSPAASRQRDERTSQQKVARSKSPKRRALRVIRNSSAASSQKGARSESAEIRAQRVAIKASTSSQPKVERSESPKRRALRVSPESLGGDQSVQYVEAMQGLIASGFSDELFLFDGSMACTPQARARSWTARHQRSKACIKWKR